MLRVVPCFLTVLLLSACTGPVESPSLMPRAVERRPIDMPATAPSETEQPADAALQAELAAQLTAAAKAQAGFAAQCAEVERAVARAVGAAPGSEPWIQAQQAISGLEGVRAPLRDIAAAIDALRDAPANVAPGNRAAIDAAAAQVAAIEGDQRTALTELTGRLR